MTHSKLLDERANGLYFEIPTMWNNLILSYEYKYEPKSEIDNWNMELHMYRIRSRMTKRLNNAEIQNEWNETNEQDRTNRTQEYIRHSGCLFHTHTHVHTHTFDGN